MHAQFFSIDYNERQACIYSRLKQTEVTKKQILSQYVQHVSRRIYTRTYSLENDTQKYVEVCKVFFLSTLGYKSDKVLISTLKAGEGRLMPRKDKRGKNEPVNE